MDNIDRFNDAVKNVAISWRNIFAFVASIFVIGTVLPIAGSSAAAWVIISWVIVAIMAFLVFFYRKGTKKEAP